MLKTTLQNDLKTAMKAGDTQTRDSVRMLLSAITTAEKQSGTELTDEAVGHVVGKVVKQTKGSIEEYERLEQPETVAKLKVELAVYQRYAPTLMSEEAVAAIVAAAIAESGATGPSDMGKVMKLVMPQVAGKADGGMVNRLVKDGLKG